MRNNNRKKSEFPSIDEVAPDAYFDFVVGGTNYRIPYADFITGLGVTGTLEQAGNVTAAPVLDKQGVDNLIRNLEAGAGIKTGISPENGITIEHNILSDNLGVPLFLNVTAPQPVIASLIPGSGISITGDDTAVTISTSGVEESVKTVVIRKKEDFPAPVLNIITLLDETEYFLANDVDLGIDRLLMGNNCTLKGASNLLITLSYTGNDALIDIIDTSNTIISLELSAPNAILIRKVETGPSSLGLTDVFFGDCQQMATLDGAGGFVRFTRVSTRNVANVLNGIKFAGAFQVFIHETSGIETGAGILYDLGTTVFDSFLISHLLTNLQPGTDFISGVVDSGNIDAGGIGVIDTLIMYGGDGANFINIKSGDSRWMMSNSNSISDTRTSGLLSAQNNAAETVISVEGTPVLVNAIWVVEDDSQMTGTTAGRLTYNGNRPATVGISANLDVEPVGGGTVNISAYIAVNGAFIANSHQITAANSGAPNQLSITWQLVLDNNDFVEVFVANEESTANIVVSSAILGID